MFQNVRIEKIYLEEICVSKGRRQTEDIVSLWMFWNCLHDGAIYDDEMFWSRLDRPALSRVARVKQ